ncbi:MAG: 6-phosphogluconolactonase [Nitrospirae bacterium]|nr:6-phosphogluconolactonase [Nitrospirota bacterium]
MSAAPELRIMNDSGELAHEAAELFGWLGQQAIASEGSFRVALPGGSTPQALYRTLAGAEFAGMLDWGQVRFFFGDERCVPPDHRDSNFAMVHECLLNPLKIQAERVFRMRGEDSQPERAAREYEDQLRQEFGTPPPAWPCFDLILLGLGEDGHTASLFPETQALGERTRLVVANEAPRGVTPRLTLTVPTINHAKAICFLVTGNSKADMVQTVLEGRDQDTKSVPAKLIKPENGRLIWFMDPAAASELTIAKQGIVSHEE